MATKVDGIPTTGALPAVPTGIATADLDTSQKYADAIQKILAAVERPRDVSLAKISAALADPGRTGHWSEGFGRAMGVLGQHQEAEQARELPIAQMRAALAGQQVELGNKQRAFGILANTMGFPDAATAAKALQTSSGIFGLGSKFTPELYAALSMADQKVADIVKNAAGMDVERFKAMTEATKTNMSIAQMYDQFGKDVTDRFMRLQGNMPLGQGAPTGRPTGQPSSAPVEDVTRSPYVVRDANGNVVDIKAQPDPDADKPVVIQGQTVTRPAAGTSTAPSDAPASGTPQVGYEQMGPGKFRLTYSGRIVNTPSGGSDADARKLVEAELAAERDIYKKTVEAGDKPFEEKTAQILQFDNQATAVNLNRIDKIQTLAQKYSKLPGVLQQTDTMSGLGKWVAAVGALAQEGPQMGKFGAFSIPVEKFVNTANMSQEQKEILGELAREISNEFLAGMRANRGLLGVNPTDNDARLFQAAAESPTSLARNIYSWAQGRAAEYESMNDIYKGYTQFRTQRGRGFDPASFFIDEKSPYHTGVKNYTERLLRVKENSPGMR